MRICNRDTKSLASKFSIFIVIEKEKKYHYYSLCQSSTINVNKHLAADYYVLFKLNRNEIRYRKTPL